MAGSQRLKRMADSVQRELSELIRQELKDPRLGGLVTISAVKVSADMGYAEVYVTVMGRELGDEQSEAANKETCFVKSVDQFCTGPKGAGVQWLQVLHHSVSVNVNVAQLEQSN